MNEKREILYGLIILVVFLGTMAGAWYWTRNDVNPHITNPVPALEKDHP